MPHAYEDGECFPTKVHNERTGCDMLFVVPSIVAESLILIYVFYVLGDNTGHVLG
jgi:hypothetical protein